MSQPQYSPRIEALVAAGVAVAALGVAGWLGWMIGWPGSFDTSDPDFVNPISIMILGLLGAAVWFGIKAVGHERRHRAFGNGHLNLDPPGHLRLGGALSGRLKVQRPVAAAGPFHMVLTCFDVHEFEDNGRFKTVDFPVWTDERTLPRETDATQGLAFRFVLPASVGLDPVPSGILPGQASRHRLTVHVPGMKQVVASNTPPVGRYWKLVVTAPTAGPEFRAEVVVPTDRPRGNSRLP
ncbi:MULTISPECIES: hypothetical protein [Tabrizicola]|uniref:hypothetical protein n=1 Tax=Tabrizicola TaxID=1443919 RepID=UPI001081A213|nr:MULTISPECIES: hypothetical protein [Paracoccaceae]